MESLASVWLACPQHPGLLVEARGVTRIEQLADVEAQHPYWIRCGGWICEHCRSPLRAATPPSGAWLRG